MFTILHTLNPDSTRAAPPLTRVPPQQHQSAESGSIGRKADMSETGRAEDANYGQLSTEQKQLFADMLQRFVRGGLFSTDPMRMIVYIDGSITLPVVDESCAPIAAKQRRFSPEEKHTIRKEASKLLDGGFHHTIHVRVGRPAAH